MTATKNSRPPARAALVKTVLAALEDMKAVNVKVFDVRRVTNVSDCMVLASGNSDRHVRSIADRVIEYAKAAGFRPMGVEGERDGEWVLVDLNDVVVHVMLPRVREFYGLEELWEPPPAAKPRASARPRAKAAPAKRPAAKPRKTAARGSAARSAPARARAKNVARGGKTAARAPARAASTAPRGKTARGKTRSRG